MTRQISKEQEKRERKEIEKGRKKIPFMGTVVRDDPHGDKEDTRPIEKRRKKPNFSMNWKKLEKVIGRGK